MGGGACWSELTCGLQTATFHEDVEGMRSLVARFGKTTASLRDQSPSGSTSKRSTASAVGTGQHVFHTGIRDPAAPEFQEMTHIFIPYCSADLHWGNSVVQYGTSGLTIRRKGAVNAGAAIGWM